MEEIELKVLLQMVKKRWWLLLSITVAALIVSAVFTFFILKPVYRADTSIYIGKNAETQGSIVYNDIMLNDRLVNDYRELVKSRLISDMVIAELRIENLTGENFSQKIQVNSKKDTRLIEISATDGDPEMAKNIADKVAEVFQAKVVEIMKVENVQIIDKAQVPLSPIKPDKKMNLAIGMVLGMMLGLGVIFLIEFLDDTIKTAEDVHRHLNLPVIGVIPAYTELKDRN